MMMPHDCIAIRAVSKAKGSQHATWGSIDICKCFMRHRKLKETALHIALDSNAARSSWRTRNASVAMLAVRSLDNDGYVQSP